jgi:hypothetical protein
MFGIPREREDFPTHIRLILFRLQTDSLKATLYVLTSKFSQNHFLSEKYKTEQKFKPHFLQNNPPVQLYSSTSDFKDAGNIPVSSFVEAFSAPPSHSK